MLGWKLHLLRPRHVQLLCCLALSGSCSPYLLLPEGVLTCVVGDYRTGPGLESLIAEYSDSATPDLSFPTHDPRTVFQYCLPSCWYLPQQGAMCPALAFGKWLKSQAVVWRASSQALILGKEGLLNVEREVPPKPLCPSSGAPPRSFVGKLLPPPCPGQLYLLED